MADRKALKTPDQPSVTEQLQELVVIANRVGLYDAADVIQARLLSPEHRLSQGEVLIRVLRPTN